MDDYANVHKVQDGFLERTGFKVGEGFDLGKAPDNIRQSFERDLADGKTLVLASGRRPRS